MGALLIDLAVLLLVAFSVWIAQRLKRGLRDTTTPAEAARLEEWKAEARARAHPRF